MKNLKNLSRRGAALLLALVLCLGTLQMTALAAEPEDGGEPAGTEDVVVPEESSQPTEDDKLPVEDEQLPVEDEKLPTEDEELPSEDDKLPVEDENLPTEDEELPPEEEVLPPESKKPDNSREEIEETPAVVQAFLNAVAAIPTITADNAAEVSEYLYGKVASAYEALLGTEYEDRADVQEAVAVMARAIAEADEAMNMDAASFASVTITPNGSISGRPSQGNLTNYAGTITKLVGESGSYLRCPPKQFMHQRCGKIVSEYIPEQYTQITNDISTSGIISDLTYARGISNDGYPCMQTNFTAEKPGKTEVTLDYYVNFCIDTITGRCNYCGYYVTIPTDYRWYEYKDTFDVTVNARYTLNYDTDGGSKVSPTTRDIPDTTADLSVTSEDSTKDGYTFLGWSDVPKNDAGHKVQYKANPTGAELKNGIKSTVTLDWEAGLGSVENPVQKTLYAVWEKNDPPEPDYTVIYTDGVKGETVFPDQGYEGLKEGEDTPEFEEDEYTKIEELKGSDGKTYVIPVRDGYEFVGWSLDTWDLEDTEHTPTTLKPIGSVHEKVDPKDVNSGDNKIIYTAVWIEEEDNSGSNTYNVTYEWTGLPENTTEPVVPKDETNYAEGTTVTVDTNFANGTEVEIDGTTYVFSGWSTEDADVKEDGTFEMPGKNVTLTGEWNPKPKYTVTYNWSGLPEDHSEMLPNGGEYFEGTEVTVDTDYPSGKSVTVNGTEYVFTGWSTSDAEVENGTFEMPGKNVLIVGTWSPVPPQPEYNVTYVWTGLPEGTTDPAVPGDETHPEGDAVTVDTEFVNGTTVTIGGRTYIFSGWSTEDAQVEDGGFTMPGQNVTIRGTWTVQPEPERPRPTNPDPDPEEPDPKPDPDPKPEPEPNPEPTPEPVPEPVPEPAPEPAPEPELPVALPDPAVPESPDVVTILEDDVPTTYVRVRDPETDELMYIPEDDVPLYGFDVPQTGDSGRTAVWAALCAASLTGAAALTVSRKKEEDGE